MIIAITGHMNLGTPENLAWIKTSLTTTTAQWPTLQKGITCLAIGADQLFAQVLYEKNIPFEAIIPSKNYEQKVPPENLDQYKDLLQKAQKVTTLNYLEPAGPAYTAAGKIMVNQANHLIAIWDGLPARGMGGTAEIVNYALEKNKPITHINPQTKTITILSPTPS